jgi:hypothetical protein
MLSLTVRFGWNRSGLLRGLALVESGIRPRDIASSRWREDQVSSVARNARCEDKLRGSNIELVYGGGLGGGEGGRVGRDVVRRLTGGERSIDGAGDVDDWVGEER